MREQHDRLGDVTDLAFDQARLIVVDQRDDVAAGNVPVVDDGETRGGEVRADVDERAGRNRGSNRPAMQHAGKLQVVDVVRSAGDLLDALLAKDVAPHRLCAHRAAMASRLYEPRTSGSLCGGFRAIQVTLEDVDDGQFLGAQRILVPACDAHAAATVES